MFFIPANHTGYICFFFFKWAQSLSSALPARGNVWQECTEFWENTHSHSRSLCGSVLSVERSEHKEGFLCSIFGTEGQWELSCCPDTNTYRLSLHCSLNNRIIVWGPWSHLLYYFYSVLNLGGTNRNSRNRLGDRASELEPSIVLQYDCIHVSRSQVWCFNILLFLLLL